jgi:hypothetical protein
MKLVREQLFELYTKFKKSEDKLSSLGVGRLPMIIEWCDRKIKNHNFSSEYIINDDLTIDIPGSVYMHNDPIPDYIQFRNIGFSEKSNLYGEPGSFIYEYVDSSINLKGCPKLVSKTFSINYNSNITSLENAPLYIGGDFYHNRCSITKEQLDEYGKKMLKYASENNLRIPYFLRTGIDYIYKEKIDESFTKSDNGDKLINLGIGYLRFTKEQLEEALSTINSDDYTPQRKFPVAVRDLKFDGDTITFNLNVSDDNDFSLADITFNDKDDAKALYRLEGTTLYTYSEDNAFAMVYKDKIKSFKNLIFALTHLNKWEDL